MVKHHTVPHRFRSVRSKKRRSRRRKSSYSERTKSDEINDNCFTITLRDVGDIDDQNLNSIPNSIQGEAYWAEKPDDSNETSVATTNPLLQVQSGDICMLCTKKLLDIHESVPDVCDHDGSDERKDQVAQSIMKVFQSITGGRLNERKVNVVQSAIDQDNNAHTKLVNKKCQNLSRAINTSNRDFARCSLSRLSIQVMCTSESTLSLTQDPKEPVLFWPPHRKAKADSITSKKNKTLETVAGALLMELCKVTAKKIDEHTLPEGQKRLLLAKDSYMPKLKSVRHGQPATGYTSLEAGLPEWLKGLCQEEDLKPPKKGILKKARSHIEKSKINIFRPLLCTKLSIPWLLPNFPAQITCEKHEEFNMMKQNSSCTARHVKNQQRSNKDRKRESKKDICKELARSESKLTTPGTKVVHAYDARNVHYLSSDSIVPCKAPLESTEVPLRLFASKTMGGVEPVKKKQVGQREDRESIDDRQSRRYSNSHQDSQDIGRVKEKRVTDICPKCQSSIQCSISIQKNPLRLRKIRTKTQNVLAYPCKKILNKPKTAGHQEKGQRRQQPTRTRENGKSRQGNGDVTTKYFIKTFLTGTSSETSKLPTKITKKSGRRKKIGVQTRTSGRAAPQEAKKRRASPSLRTPNRRHVRADKEDTNSEIELEIQASEEMDIINHHIKAHKTASGSAPMYHTCFKRLLDKELNQQSCTKQPRKISNGGYFFSRPTTEVKRFNEGIFSCLIPKVFK